MPKITVGVGITGKDPFAKHSGDRIRQVLNRAAEEARQRFLDHGRYYTGGIAPVVESPTSETRVVGSYDQRVVWVNLGTRDHYIAPRSGGRLAFSANYVNKTQRSVIPSRPGGPSGPTVYSDGHMVSGIEAREVHVAIAEEVGPRFVREILRVIRL